MSTSSLSGRLVIRMKRTRPRLDVSLMNSLSRATTREPVPPSVSPPSPPEPNERSPSSMMTMMLPMARTTSRIFSRFDSVEPTHLERKFLSLIPVSPPRARKPRPKVCRSPSAGEQQAHRHRLVRPRDVAGDAAQLALISSMPRPPRSRGTADELDQAEALALDDLALRRASRASACPSLDCLTLGGRLSAPRDELVHLLARQPWVTAASARAGLGAADERLDVAEARLGVLAEAAAPARSSLSAPA